MSPILLRFLPHGLVAVAVIGAYLWIDHRGYERATRDREFERQVTALMLTRAARDVEQNLGASMAKRDEEYAAQRRSIETVRTTHQSIITKEIGRDARLSDPALGITDELREALNAARRETGACAPTAAGGIRCALPAPDGTGREEHRRTDAGGL
ncbi:hypothetical protein [Sphingobium lignivorans]|uniref:Bacteriophage Rz lysis protein n=1 Tax=Sphingobium lignivorans TaxID=2735886 RepID=A0ABR6NF92_9SPHN|nr:hypothetical protein [Sphingobium lignivorans]MBB5985947.1 hypothetical protein [Sphingobium lignivorans]